jgi:DNA mismatch repair protein MutL
MINILPKELVNHIAAGEVVERPASVVKELVENSLDAGAKKISISVTNGGLDSMVIEDDGIGISKADAPKLFKQHATSKISSLDDLSKIASFGFRGEALASIASVSLTTITTHNATDSVGIEIRKNDDGVDITSAPINTGTVIRIENLFYNTPARRKFMKSEKTEFSYIARIVEEIALVHPEVAFSVSHNGRKIVDVNTSSLQDRIRSLVKIDLSQLTDFYTSEQIHIYGCITKPGSLETSSVQYLYVNKRPITSPLIQKAVKEAYKTYLKKELKPSYVLFIDMDPTQVDVNVHPRKTEVRFYDQRQLFNLVYTGIGKSFEREQENTYEHPLMQTITRQQYGKPTPTDVTSSLSFTKQLLANPRRQESTSSISEFTPVDEVSEFDDIAFFQMENKFIVFSYDNALTILDQHAASERVTYERISTDFHDGSFSFSLALFPLALELSASDYAFVLDNLDDINHYGLGIEDLGHSMVSMTKIATSIPQEKAKELFFEVVDILKLGKMKNQPITSLDEKVIASLACRSAVMFGQRLSEEEMRVLVKDLYKCKVPFTCAHGRPVKYILPYAELLKKLARC